jgi:hypothetical protein
VWRCKKKCKRRKNDVKNSLAKSIANGVNRIELDVKQWNSIIVEDSFRDEHAFSQIQDQPYGNAQMLNDFQNCVHVLLSRRSSRVVGKRKGEQAGKGTVRGVLEKRSIVRGKRGLARYVLGTALCSRERCRNKLGAFYLFGAGATNTEGSARFKRPQLNFYPRAARTPKQQHSTFYLFSANAAAVRAIRLAPTLQDALRGAVGGRKKICDGRVRSATPGIPVNVRWWKTLR